ncbi:MAG: nucleotide-binding protein [Candidatus Nezhaarchaeota archaeon]|nr:nucleotide-binding protein [Candidatus Nezhaarchaeota archaeon]
MKYVVEVALDSNFLMLPMVGRINLTSELDRLLTVSYRLVVPRCVVEELNRLASQGTPLEKRRARFALRLLDGLRAEVVEVPRGASVDETIAQGALSHGWVVATNDAKLRLKLRSCGVPVIYLRGGKRLILEGKLG